MKPGKYEGIIADWGIGENTNGPYPWISFDVEDGDNVCTLRWFGNFKDGERKDGKRNGRDITIDSLLACNFKGNDITVLSKGVEGKALKVGTSVNLTIEFDRDWKTGVKKTLDNGDDCFKVKWINGKNESSFGSCDVKSHEDYFKSMTGDIMGRRQETGIEDKKEEPEPQPVPDDEIPF